LILEAKLNFVMVSTMISKIEAFWAKMKAEPGSSADDECNKRAITFQSDHVNLTVMKPQAENILTYVPIVDLSFSVLEFWSHYIGLGLSRVMIYSLAVILCSIS
jgi:hypothetical protein